MRELERDTASDTPACARLAIVGRGRLGNALAAALAGRPEYEVIGPLGRGTDGRGTDGRGTDGGGTDGGGTDGRGADAVLLCVPDGQIALAASRLAAGPLVGHCSGATGLDVLAPHEGFLLHPLMTVASPGARLADAGAAVAGTTPRALRFAERLADALALRPVSVADADRPAYHAAASIASNFLVTLEAMAERIAQTAGVDRGLLVPLVRATVENWAELGPEQALTGPVARGDEITVARQRAAVAERAPELLPAFDALVEATRELAGRQSAEAADAAATADAAVATDAGRAA